MTYQIKYRVINSETARKAYIQETTYIWGAGFVCLNDAYGKISDGQFNHSIWTFWVEEQS